MTTFSITPHGIIANILVGRMHRRNKPDMVLWDLGCSVTKELSLTLANLFLELVPSYTSGLTEQLYSRGRIFEMLVYRYHRWQYDHQYESPPTRWSWEEVLLKYQPTVVPPTSTIHHDISLAFAFRSPFHFLQMHTHAKHLEHHLPGQTTTTAPFGARLDYPNGTDLSNNKSGRDMEFNDRRIRIIGTTTSESLRLALPIPTSTRLIRPHTLPIVLNLRISGGEYLLSLGLCSNEVSVHGSRLGSVHWANIRRTYTYGDPRAPPGTHQYPASGHDCATDHVHEWPDLTKEFPFNFFPEPVDLLSSFRRQSTRTFVLAFTRCLANPTVTLDLKLTATVTGPAPVASR